MLVRKWMATDHLIYIFQLVGAAPPHGLSLSEPHQFPPADIWRAFISLNDSNARTLPHTLTTTAFNMSDNGEVEIENPGFYPALPKDVQTDSVKLFDKWSYVSASLEKKKPTRQDRKLTSH